MIFIGGGSLLWRAVRVAVQSRHTVDLVCVGRGESIPPGPHSFEVLVSDDVIAEHERIHAACSDGVVWSINNSWILKPPLVRPDSRIYNIHNGPLPAFRGRPEVAIVHALLAGETSYGASLHEVDCGIDTGPVVDVESFDVGPQDRFQDVMMSGLRACHTLFERNLDAVIDGHAKPLPASSEPSGYYGRNRIKTLTDHRQNPNYERATALGVFSPIYPELVAALEHNARSAAS
ncbi:MAG: hypothetical protein GX610_06190 [Rhodococcus sp.]|nr:hypothetical protein [Rhodococcus sp. (in: high G+C Gram-positive bacteria)]